MPDAIQNYSRAITKVRKNDNVPSHGLVESFKFRNTSTHMFTTTSIPYRSGLDNDNL